MSTAYTDQIRRHYAQLIDALMADGHTAEANECARVAVQQGVWGHSQQRPLQYVPSVPSRPVYDPQEYWFVRYLEENYARIRHEIEAVTDPRRQGFRPVEEPLLDRGRWDQVIFYEAGQRFETACQRFPVTAGIMSKIPEATTFGPGVVTLSWLYPGTHIIPHCGHSNARLRVHLGIKVPAGVSIRVGEEMFSWQEGKCIVFDDSFEHEIWHHGTEPRIVLLFDVLNPILAEQERQRLLQQRTSQDDLIRSFMTEHGLARITVNGPTVQMQPTERVETMIRRYLQDTNIAAVELVNGQLRFDHDPATAS